jgi:hypothetical protein
VAKRATDEYSRYPAFSEVLKAPPAETMKEPTKSDATKRESEERR